MFRFKLLKCEEFAIFLSFMSIIVYQLHFGQNEELNKKKMLNEK